MGRSRETGLDLEKWILTRDTGGGETLQSAKIAGLNKLQLRGEEVGKEGKDEVTSRSIEIGEKKKDPNMRQSHNI